MTANIKPRFNLVKRPKGKFVISEGESIDVSWDGLGSIKLKSSSNMQVRLGLLGNLSEIKLTKDVEQSFQRRN